MTAVLLNACMLGFAASGFSSGPPLWQTKASVSEEQPLAKFPCLPANQPVHTDLEKPVSPIPKAVGATAKAQTETPDEKTAHRLEQILREWEAESSQIKSFTATFKRFSYDEVWGIERRATGTFHFVAPNDAAYVVHGVEVPKGTRSVRKSNSGEPFRTVVKAQNEHWITSAREIYCIDDPDRTFDVGVRHPKSRAEISAVEAEKPNWFWGYSLSMQIVPRVLVFDIPFHAAEARRSHEFVLAKESETEIVIRVKPRGWPETALHREAAFILTKPGYRIKAVRTIDPPGTKEIVHFFNLDELIINPPGLDSDSDPFHPQLENYKRIVGAAASPPAPKAKKREATPQ